MFKSFKNIFGKSEETTKNQIQNLPHSNSSEGVGNDDILENNETAKEELLTEEEIKYYIDRHIYSKVTPSSNLSDISLCERDSLFDDAARIVVMSGQGSASFLQRKLKLGYNRAGRLIEQLEAAGIVSSFNGSSNRQVLINDVDSLNLLLSNLSDSSFLNRKVNLFYEKYYQVHENYINEQIKLELNIIREKEEEMLKENIKQELLEKERKKRIAREAREELINDGLIYNSNVNKEERRITQDVKDKVWNRDGGKCVECGSNEKLEFDHIIPFIKGGSNTYRNIQLLCERCNRIKSANIG